MTKTPKYRHRCPFAVYAVVSGILLCGAFLCQKALATDVSNHTDHLILPIQIKGTVTDASGQAIPGATVVVDGETKGTTTDLNGNFVLDAPQGSTLLISFIGYKTQKVLIGNQSVVNIILEEDLSSLEEVVVIGYGTVKKSDLTGAVSSIKGESIREFPVTSIDQAVQGRAAGVQVTQASASPGGGVSVRIRGSNSINSGSEPLYVIDGFPLYPDNGAYGVGGNRQPSNIMATINPNDIESIEILKDASATSIYGSRGSNGVVLITTKRGKAGETSIEYDGSVSMQTISKKIDVLNARDYAIYLNTMEQSQGGAPLYSEEEINAMGEGTNWLNEIIQTGAINSHQLTFSGGSDKNRYAIVGNYFKNNGIIKYTDFERYGIRLNLDNSAWNGRLMINSSWSYNRTQSNNAPTDRGGPGGIIITALGLDPSVPVRDAEGEYALASYDGRFNINPLQELENVADRDVNNRVLGNTGFSLNVIEGLTLKTSIGADILNAGRTTFFPVEISRLGRDRSGELTKANRNAINILNENILTFDKRFNTQHSLNLIGGYTFQKEVNEGMSATNRGLSASHVDQATLGGGTDIQIPFSDRREWLLKSLLARANYNLMDKYLLTVSFRRDGSSRFGAANKWANFPSVALAWRIVEEGFFQSSTLSRSISDLKLRGSWGITGNSEIPVYNSQANLNAYNYVFGGNLVLGLADARLSNPGLKWETTKMVNVGLDLSLLDNRLNLTAEYFFNHTEDLLLYVTVPSSLGFNSILKNSGSLENKGFEVSLNYIAVDSRDLRWDVSGNISFLRNKITDLGSSTPFFSGSTSGHLGIDGSWVEAGNPIGVWRGYKYTGIFQNQAEIDANPSRSGDKPGYPRYQDSNQDGTITPDDYVIIGDPNPDFTWGFTSTLNYKQFDLNLFIRGVHGNEIRNLQQAEIGDGVQKINQIANILTDSWTPQNPSASRPVIDGNRDFANSYRDSDYFIEDGSFIRVQNIALGYNLPPLSKFIRKARVYISAQNPMLFTKYKGFDPEVNNRGQNNLNRGDDYDAYPRSKTFNIGINLGL